MISKFPNSSHIILSDLLMGDKFIRGNWPYLRNPAQEFDGLGETRAQKINFCGSPLGEARRLYVIKRRRTMDGFSINRFDRFTEWI